jgi:hypothetical protein
VVWGWSLVGQHGFIAEQRETLEMTFEIVAVLASSF